MEPNIHAGRLPADRFFADWFVVDRLFYYDMKVESPELIVDRIINLVD